MPSWFNVSLSSKLIEKEASGKYKSDNSFETFKDNIDDNYIENINTLVYNKYVISKNILETDYYRKLVKED